MSSLYAHRNNKFARLGDVGLRIGIGENLFNFHAQSIYLSHISVLAKGAEEFLLY